MPSPLIGLTCCTDWTKPTPVHTLSSAYVNALVSAGATPVILPSTDRAGTAGGSLESLEGLVLTGGGDIAPHLFGEEPDPKLRTVDPVRDSFEMELAEAALERKMPVLAICRGLQLVNVLCGGSIWQDLSLSGLSPVQHLQKSAEWCPNHTVSVSEGSLLHRILGNTSIRVNSIHHQAVRRPGHGLRVSATAADGVVEAVEAEENRFVLGVQWHPELMVRTNPEASRLFSAFVAAAGEEGRASAG